MLSIVSMIAAIVALIGGAIVLVAEVTDMVKVGGLTKVGAVGMCTIVAGIVIGMLGGVVCLVQAITQVTTT